MLLEHLSGHFVSQYVTNVSVCQVKLKPVPLSITAPQRGLVPSLVHVLISYRGFLPSLSSIFSSNTYQSLAVTISRLCTFLCSTLFKTDIVVVEDAVVSLR